MKQDKTTEKISAGSSRPTRNGWGVQATLLLFLAVALLGYLPLFPSSVRQVALNLGPAIAGAISFLLGVAQFRQARQVTLPHLAYANIRRHGMGWLLLGFGSLCVTIGDLYWTIYEWAGGTHPPNPSPGDIAYLLLYPLQIAGLACLFRLNTPVLRLRQVADGFIASVASFVITWQLAVEPLWYGGGTSLPERLIVLSYPVLDMASLFGVLVLAVAATRSLRDAPIYLLLCAGIVAWTLADVLFARDMLRDVYQTGMWYDIFWMAAQVSIVLSSLAAQARLRQLIKFPLLHREPVPEGIEAAHSGSMHRVRFMNLHRLRLPTRMQTLLPYSLTAGTILLTTIHEALEPGARPALSGAFLLLTALVLGRQGLTLLENRRLLTVLQQTSAALDATAKERTLQLSVLHALIVAVNDTQDEEQVVKAALHHTRRAITADRFALWLYKKNESRQTFPVLYQEEGLTTPPDLIKRLEKIALPETTVQLRLDLQGQHHIMEEVIQDAEGQHRSLCSGKMHCLLTPLVAQGRQLGALAALREVDTFTETDVEIIEGIGRAVGTALHNARAYREARQAADHDPLTDLLNHRAVQERMRRALSEAEQTQQEVAVLMIDVNNFKLLNDTHGHLIGDQMLLRITTALTRVCPLNALVGRYGGDEFLIALPALPPDQGHQAAEKLAHAIEIVLDHEAFPLPDSEVLGDKMRLSSLPVSVSIGVAVYPRDGTNRHELLTHADRNMYQAKYGGQQVVARARRPRTSGAPMAEVTSPSLTDTFSLLDAMIQAIDNKDQYTRRHSDNVTEYALCLLRAIEENRGGSGLHLRTLQVAGLLHDIGKIGVRDEILRKPGVLTHEEEETMRRHPLTGALIVAAMPELAHLPDLVGAIRAHHEHWDGSGYPDGLRGEAIPYLGRILAVADAFDAMTTNRPYRKAFTRDEALHRIADGAGTHFDPVIAHAFVHAAPKCLF